MHSHLYAKQQIIFLRCPSSTLLQESNLQTLLSKLNAEETYVSELSNTEQVHEYLTKEFNVSALLVDASFLSPKTPKEFSQLLKDLNDKFNGLPVFLLLNEREAMPTPLRIPEKMHEIINIKEDSPSFIAGRVRYAIQHYVNNILPPYFKALKNFAKDSPYYWDCPGHQGGVAYLKHQIGRAFIDFFGENIMRADIGIATPDLGDWLEHKGPPAESEAAAARIFGADMTFYVTGGSSQSNQIVGHGVLTNGTLALVDRNCHKSVNHELTVTESRPVYFKPERNGLGIIGLIPLEQFKAKNVQDRIKQSPFAKSGKTDPGYAVVTNCTYDGLIYNVDKVTEALADSVPRIKYDEAWYAYAKFHPLYKSRFAMGVPKDLKNCPTIFSVQSTHKMLAAFSSASMIHVRNSSRAPVDKEIFNQSFAMHGTTSPFYPIIASIDVATAMMEGEGGKRLLHDALVDAIACRKTLVRTAKLVKSKKDWFFGVWQPEKLSLKSGKTVDFEDVDDELLLSHPELWYLKKGEEWHGFKKVDGDYAMLDPLKVTITCPGASADGKTENFGIPANIVCQYLNAQRIIQARNGDYNILVLFALGSTRGKWATLIEALMEFKRLHDSDASVARALPDLVAQHPQYQSYTLKELCAQMHKLNTESKLASLAGAACEAQAKPVYTPAQAFQHLIGGNTEKILVKNMMNRTAGLMITPYPPGIPVLMPGEQITKESKAILDYLLALQDMDKKFPGFSHELQGIEVDENGEYWIRCIKE